MVWAIDFKISLLGGLSFLVFTNDGTVDLYFKHKGGEQVTDQYIFNWYSACTARNCTVNLHPGNTKQRHRRVAQQQQHSSSSTAAAAAAATAATAAARRWNAAAAAAAAAAVLSSACSSNLKTAVVCSAHIFFVMPTEHFSSPHIWIVL